MTANRKATIATILGALVAVAGTLGVQVAVPDACPAADPPAVIVTEPAQ